MESHRRPLSARREVDRIKKSAGCFPQLLTFRCLLADLERDDAPGEKAASRIAVILKRLSSSTFDVAVKFITDIGSATVKKMLGL